MLGESSIAKQGHSSLPLQILIYFNMHFVFFFFILNICLFTYKAVLFYYPAEFLGWELTTVFLYLLVDYTRLLLVSKGNKTNQFVPISGSWVLSIPLVVLHAYYMELQTYVLQVDLVINAISLFFIGSELILSIAVFISLVNASKRF